MADEFTKLLQQLHDKGISDSEIARDITATGVEVTQPSISRLRVGQIKHPRYELGVAIKGLPSLYKTRLAAANIRLNGRRERRVTG